MILAGSFRTAATMTAASSEMAEDHEHRYDLVLGMDGRGRLFGNYEGYVHQCKCGEYREDYLDYLEGFHDCPACGAQHRVAKVEQT